MAQEKFKSRSGFILASVGAAVGLGNALRFPGLCAKYGGGTFLLIYFVALVIMGVPILNAEIALGRKIRGGAPKCMASLNKRAEPLGWASCFNSLIVAIIYAGLLGWIIAMVVKIVPLCASSQVMSKDEVGGYFFTEVMGKNVSALVAACIIAAWVIMFFCLRGGANTLSKTAKFTVIIPIILLTFMAGRGLMYSNSGEALKKLFVPDFSALGNAELWLNALGQVFFSLSILVGIMPAYGGYLPDGANIFRDSIIIAAADFFVSVLSSVVLFTTLYGCGLQSDLSQSGIVTAFVVYPAAITVAFGENVVLNSIVGILFYSSLAMMAAQSSVSMLEAAANPLSEKLKIPKKKLAAVIACIGAAVCLVFATPIAQTVLDVCDHFANYFNILFLGIAECVILGRGAKKAGLVEEINRFTKKTKMPEKVFIFSIKFLCPTVLIFLTGWGIYHLIFIERGQYNGYPVWAQIIGWLASAVVFSSGFLVKIKLPKFKKLKRQSENI
ncbi:MAG: hypothetical protein K2N22_05610 [Clostridia bacterium]|nr:hypothetical protein [Clostridia bacterium]